MSRPYVNINSATYNSSTDVVTLDITALRLRGQSEFTISGFTQSYTIPLTDGYYSNSSYTFLANINGTASGGNTGAQFTPATADFVFGGTATGGATKTNVKIQVFGDGGPYSLFGSGGYTFSADKSTTAAVAELAANIKFLPTGATATANGNTLTLIAPANTGAYYNGNEAKLQNGVLGTGGFTFSNSYYSGTWQGGTTTFTLSLTSSSFGTVNQITFNAQ
jgi:hypothetical protein